MAILSVTLASIQAAVTIKMMEVKAQIDGSTNVTLQYQNGYYVGSVSLQDGNHHVRIFARDNAGNVNSSEVVYFSVLTQSPPANSRVNHSWLGSCKSIGSGD